MAIADWERELIIIRTIAALDEKRKRVGEKRGGSQPLMDSSDQVKGVEGMKEKVKADFHNKQVAKLIQMS